MAATLARGRDRALAGQDLRHACQRHHGVRRLPGRAAVRRYQRFAVEAGFPGQHRHRRRRGCGPRSCPRPVAVTIHIGPHKQMAPAYEALASWVSSCGGEPAGDLWEVYFSDLASEPDPATWRTEIVQPYRPV
jgi:hypothetical protein